MRIVFTNRPTIFASLAILFVLAVSTQLHAGMVFHLGFNQDWYPNPPSPPYVGRGTISFDDDLIDGTYLINGLTNYRMDFFFALPDPWSVPLRYSNSVPDSYGIDVNALVVIANGGKSISISSVNHSVWIPMVLIPYSQGPLGSQPLYQLLFLDNQPQPIYQIYRFLGSDTRIASQGSYGALEVPEPSISATFLIWMCGWVVKKRYGQRKKKVG